MTPSDTLQFAESLCSSAESEAEYRVVASRAYLAVFQHAVRHRKLDDFSARHSGDDHRAMIEHLKKSKDQTLYRLGQRLPRLRSIRNHADYKLEVPFSKDIAVEALEFATEIFTGFLP